MTKLSGGDSKDTLYCSFCGKSQHEATSFSPDGDVTVSARTSGSMNEYEVQQDEQSLGATTLLKVGDHDFKGG